MLILFVFNLQKQINIPAQNGGILKLILLIMTIPWVSFIILEIKK